MKIRKATEKDAISVAKVLLESYNMSSLSEAKEAFLLELRKEHHYVVAEDNGEIVGVASWTVHDLPKHELAELNRIAVLGSCRGKGVAQKLFDGLVSEVKAFYVKTGFKLRKLYLLTHHSNDRAKKFYEKLGFKLETTLKNHYYDKEDEDVYSIFP